MSVKPGNLLLASTSVLAIQIVLLGPLAAQTFTYSDGQNATAPIMLNPPGATLDVATGSATQSGVVSETASSAITKTGAGTLTLTGANTFTGGTTLSAGTLVLGNVDALGGGMVAPQTGTELRIATSGAFVDVLRLLVGVDATISVTHGTNVSWTGYTLYSNSTLHFGSAGNDGTITLYATAPNGFASNTTLSVDYGTFRPGDALTAGTTTPGQYVGTLNVGAAGTYDLNGFNAVAGNLTGVGKVVNNGASGAVFTMTGGTSTFAGSIQDGAARAGLAIAGGATLTLTGANTYTGGTTITSGTLQIGNGGTTGSIAGDVVDNGTLAFNRSDAATFAGTISGSGVVSQAGSGTLTLTGTNTYSGGTTIDAGTLVAGSATALGVGTVTLATGTELVLGASATYLNPLRLLNGLEATLSTAHGIDATLIGYFLYPGSTLHVGSAGNDGTVTMEGLGGSGFGTNATISVDYGTFRPGDARTAGASGLANGTIDTINVGAAGTYDLNGFQAMATNLTGAGRITNNGASAAAFTMNGGTGSFSGVIQDGTATTALTIGGNGSLTLTGNNSYTGGTTIVSGTLQIGNGGTSGSIAGDVVDNGTLVFDRSDAVSLAGAISGSGVIRQAGTGKTFLTGDSSAFAGTTDVEAGTLAVNGRLGGSLDVMAGGRLQGIGTVGDTLVSGTLAPGNSIGTLSVTGEITFNAGSIFEVEANAAGQADRINATGIATLNGGSVQVLAGTGNYAPATRYTILTATGGVFGTFAGVASNLAFLDASLSYDAADVYLTLTRNVTTFRSVGSTPNQVAAGGGVESLGLGNTLYDAVLDLSKAQADAAFDQLSGEIHASTRTTLIEDGRFLRSAVTDRIRSAFDSVAAARDPVVTYGDGKSQFAAATTGGVALWTQGFGAWGHHDGDGNAARLGRSNGGLFLGVDTAAFDNWRLGAVAGYSRTTFRVTDRNSSGSSYNYHAGLYGGTQWGRLALRTGVAGTWSNVATNRSVSFTEVTDSLKAGYDAGLLQAFGEFGYGLRADRFGFEPFANLAYVGLRTGGFAEQGGLTALTAAAATTNVTFTTLGVRTSASLAAAGLDATTKTTFGWRHAFGDTTPAVALRLASGGDAFSVAGVPIGRDAAIVETGLDLALTRASALNVAYSAQLGNGFADQSLKAGFNVKF